MKKNLRKVFVSIGLIGIMSASLVGCKKKTECESCEEIKKCQKYEVTVLGESEEGYLCDDCYEEMKAYVSLLGGKIKKK